MTSETPDKASPRNHQKRDRWWSRSWWTKRRLVWLCSLLGIGLPLGWVVWPYVSWPTRLRVSKETTWLTEPLDEDGFPDYVAWTFGQRDCLPVADDPWLTLHEMERAEARTGDGLFADEILWKPIIDALANAGIEDGSGTPRYDLYTDIEYDLMPRLRRFPWTTDEHPEAAAAIDENASWYSRVRRSFTPVNTAGRTVAPANVWDASVATITLQGAQVSHEFVKRHQLRAALKFGNGHVESAIADVGFCYQIASRDRDFLIEFDIRTTNEKRAACTLICGLFNAEQLSSEAIARVQKLPVSSLIVRLVHAVHIERLMYLDQLVCIQKTGNVEGFYRLDFKTKSQPEQYLLGRRLANCIDWNSAAVDHNRYIDRVIAAVSKGGFATGWDVITSEFDEDRVAEARKKLQDASLADHPTTEEFLPIQRLDVRRSFTLATAAHLRRRMNQVALLLAVYRLRHGQYPGSLDQLTSLPEFKTAPKDCMIDPFTDKQLIYKRTSDGFEIVSVGPNQTFDSSGILELDLNQDRNNLTGDDYIWRWPCEK